MNPNSVFRALWSLSPDQFTEGAYQFSLVLRRRALLEFRTIEESLPWAKANGDVLEPAILDGIKDSLRRIEEAEGEHLWNLSDDKLLKYRRALDELLFSKLPPPSASNGAGVRAMLESLRNVAAPIRKSPPGHRAVLATKTHTG